jgi:hypothetical protein
MKGTNTTPDAGPRLAVVHDGLKQMNLNEWSMPQEPPYKSPELSLALNTPHDFKRNDNKKCAEAARMKQEKSSNL